MAIFKIHTDGASRGNPGIASYGFVIKNDQSELIYQEGQFIGIQTNNVAEYTAVLKAFEWLLQNKNEEDADLKVFADSQLLIRQLLGQYKIKNPNLKILFDQIKKMESQFNSVEYTHVPREENKQADKMANIALDALTK